MKKTRLGGLPLALLMTFTPLSSEAFYYWVRGDSDPQYGEFVELEEYNQTSLNIHRIQPETWDVIHSAQASVLCNAKYGKLVGVLQGIDRSYRASDWASNQTAVTEIVDDRERALARETGNMKVCLQNEQQELEEKAARQAAAEAEALKAEQEAEVKAAAEALKAEQEARTAGEAEAKARAAAEAAMAAQEQLTRQVAVQTTEQPKQQPPEQQEEVVSVATTERPQEVVNELPQPISDEAEEPQQEEPETTQPIEESVEKPNIFMRIWRFFTSWF